VAYNAHNLFNFKLLLIFTFSPGSARRRFGAKTMLHRIIFIAVKQLTDNTYNSLLNNPSEAYRPVFLDRAATCQFLKTQTQAFRQPYLSI